MKNSLKSGKIIFIAHIEKEVWTTEENPFGVNLLQNANLKGNLSEKIIYSLSELFQSATRQTCTAIFLSKQLLVTWEIHVPGNSRNEIAAAIFRYTSVRGRGITVTYKGERFHVYRRID